MVASPLYSTPRTVPWRALLQMRLVRLLYGTGAALLCGCYWHQRYGVVVARGCGAHDRGDNTTPLSPAADETPTSPQRPT